MTLCRRVRVSVPLSHPCLVLLEDVCCCHASLVIAEGWLQHDACVTGRGISRVCVCVDSMCSVSVAGLSSLVPLTRLQVLRLAENAFSGRVFPSLSQFRQLILLDLNGTRDALWLSPPEPGRVRLRCVHSLCHNVRPVSSRLTQGTGLTIHGTPPCGHCCRCPT